MPYQVRLYQGCCHPVPHHGVQRSPHPPSGVGGHLGKFGERQNSGLSTFLLLFFFLRNFFPQLLMTLPFLGVGGGDSGFCSPYTPSAGQSSTFHKKPELQSFLKMRWRGVSSLPSSNSPSPQSPVHSLAREAPPGWEETPAHSSPHCHTAEIKDTSSSWVSASLFKLKSGRGGPEPQLHATWKESSKPIWLQPLGKDLELG